MLEVGSSAKAVEAANAKAENRSGYFIGNSAFTKVAQEYHRSAEITRPLCAALTLATRLPIRAEILLSFATPVDAAGKVVVRRAVVLIVHLLGTQVAARNLDTAQGNGFVFHNTSSSGATGKQSALYCSFGELNFVTILAQWLCSVDSRFSAF